MYLTRTAEARLKLVATRPHEQRGVAELRHRDIVAGVELGASTLVWRGADTAILNYNAIN